MSTVHDHARKAQNMGRPDMDRFAVRLAICLAFFASIASPSYGQGTPIVRCQISTWVQIMPDFVCDALTKGATKITGDISSYNQCFLEASRHLRIPIGQEGAVIDACVQIGQAKLLAGDFRIAPPWLPSLPKSASQKEWPSAVHCSYGADNGYFVMFWATKSDCDSWIAKITGGH